MSMLMVDSNVIIDFWREPKDEWRRVFWNYTCCICGVQAAELLHGAVSDEHLGTIWKALSDFTMIAVEPADWKHLGQFLYRLRKRGVQVPFPDALIASLAVKYNMPVWTHDKHFLHIQTVYHELQLFPHIV